MQEEDPCHLRLWVMRRLSNQSMRYDNIPTNIEHGWYVFVITEPRAWRTVEITFGILANKWGIFHKPFFVKPYICESIMKACYVLHDYVWKNDCIQFDTLY
jgi:hypothetical protein